MMAVLERAGVCDLTRRFVGVVGQNRRLFAMGGMIGAFLAMLARRRGEETAYVSSAAALSDEQLERLAESCGKPWGRRCGSRPRSIRR